FQEGRFRRPDRDAAVAVVQRPPPSGGALGQEGGVVALEGGAGGFGGRDLVTVFGLRRRCFRGAGQSSRDFFFGERTHWPPYVCMKSWAYHLRPSWYCNQHT